MFYSGSVEEGGLSKKVKLTVTHTALTSSNKRISDIDFSGFEYTEDE